jgi:hypothetical protein
MSGSPLTTAQLEELDASIERMLWSGEQGDVEILGAGEITCVFGRYDHACKRLPPFSTVDEANYYASLLDRYVSELRSAGLNVIDTSLGWCHRKDGRVTAYVLQRAQPRSTLLPLHLRAAPRAQATALFGRILQHVLSSVNPRLGLDAQLTNWCLLDDRLVLLDTTTPLMRNDQGAELLPTEVFVAALPTVIRGFIRRFYVRELLDRFYEPRGVILDLLGNMANYGLDHHTEAFLEEANRALPKPLTMNEIVSYRRQEALTWKWLRRMLMLEQLWQRKVRRSGNALVLPWRFQLREPAIQQAPPERLE